MKNYVITCGTDCDGGFSASLEKYTTEKLAAESAQHSNDWSDGVGHYIADEEQAKRFAEYYGLTMPNYAFDENCEIVPDDEPRAIEVWSTTNQYLQFQTSHENNLSC